MPWPKPGTEFGRTHGGVRPVRVRALTSRRARQQLRRRRDGSRGRRPSAPSAGTRIRRVDAAPRSSSSFTASSTADARRRHQRRLARRIRTRSASAPASSSSRDHAGVAVAQHASDSGVTPVAVGDASRRRRRRAAAAPVADRPRARPSAAPACRRVPGALTSTFCAISARTAAMSRFIAASASRVSTPAAAAPRGAAKVSRTAAVQTNPCRFFTPFIRRWRRGDSKTLNGGVRSISRPNSEESGIRDQESEDRIIPDS